MIGRGQAGVIGPARAGVLAFVLAGCAAEPPRTVAPLRYDAHPAGDGDAPSGAPASLSQLPKPSEEASPACEAARATTLSNGMRLVVAERHGYPAVAVRLALAVPADVDASAFVLEFTGSVLFDPASVDADAAAECNRAGCILGAWGRAGHLKDALSRLAALGASRDPVTVLPALRRALHNWHVSGKSAWTALDRNVRVALFGRTFWGEPASLPPDPTLPSLERLRARLLTGAAATLVVTGDVSFEEARRAAEPSFGGWPAGTASRPAAESAVPPASPAPSPRDTVDAVRVNNESLGEALAQIVAVGPAPDAPDAPAFAIAVHVLGTGMTSRLFRRVRDDKGDAYDVGGGVSWTESASVARIGGAFDNDTALDALRDLLALNQAMHTGGISDEELRRGRAALRATTRRQQATAGALAGALARAALGDFRAAPCELARRADDVTAADVLRAAQRYLDPHRITLVVVGSADDVGPWLPELGVGPIHRRDGFGHDRW